MKRKILTASIVLLLLVPFVSAGCGDSKTEAAGEGFAIYLTKDDIPVSRMPMLSHVDIADEPIIAIDDIVAYKWAIHAINLTPEAYERVDELEVPTSGRSFVVCVDKAPVYWGAFWAGYSSQSFDGVTINVKPIFPVEDAPFSFQIGLGFPAASFFQGDDPRSNPITMESLEQAGKLK